MTKAHWQKKRNGAGAVAALLLIIAIFAPALSHADGWTHWWSESNNTMYWAYDGNWRLAYRYGEGQWWDCIQLGGTDNWNKLGSAGQSPDFLGNAAIGQYLPVGNGWSYGYNTTNDTGYWMNSAGNFRFAYIYYSGQWWDQNLNLWNQIGAASVSSQFIGDGQFHDLKNNWSYQYLTSNDTEYWATGGANRLAYWYTEGRWSAFDYLGGEQVLSAKGLPSTLVGDGTWHDLGNNWLYMLGGGNFGVWKSPSLNLQQFAYDYTSGQWYDQGLYGGWATLGASGLTGAFVADGAWHDLGGNWLYLLGDGNYGIWKNSRLNSQQFAYNYGSGQWIDCGKDGTWQILSANGLSPNFVGDGAWHDLGNNWLYMCQIGVVGTWYSKILNLTQFWYDYQAGKWYHQGVYGGGQTLGEFFLSTGMPCGFLGDGNWHLVGRNGYQYPGSRYMSGFDYYTDYVYYKYDIESGLGQWYMLGNGTTTAPMVTFAYDYVKGQWYLQGNYGGPTPLGSAGVSAGVMADGHAHSLGNIGDGNWQYWTGNTTGFFEHLPSLPPYPRYGYDYRTGQWYYQANIYNGGLEPIGSPGAPPSFSGPF
jgi:hypothetical protein